MARKTKPDLAGRSQARFSRAGRRRQRPCWHRLSASISTTDYTVGFGPDLGQMGNCLGKMGSHLPQLLQQKLAFPYREGSQFTQWAHAAKGWAGVNAVFADPPFSTSQILHPEKYYVKREDPLAIRASGLARQMKESAVVDQTLGEYLVQLLLTSNLSRQEASQIAAAWTGDQLSAYL